MIKGNLILNINFKFGFFKKKKPHGFIIKYFDINKFTFVFSFVFKTFILLRLLFYIVNFITI